jgi:hypothetical protein
MPRKQKSPDLNNEKNVKKNLLNTMVKNMNKDEHIVLQLPLSQTQIEKIVNTGKTCNNKAYDLLPYEHNCCYLDEQFNNTLQQDNEVIFERESSVNHKNQCCFWCCHNIDYKVYGMPINYDSINDSYVLYGTFCSLQCANAYNFSIHTGSDKLWEVNSMIQMLGKRYGYNNFIRPAPSRYLLKMFNGDLTIEEFRKLHKNSETTHVLNLPPMIAISSGYEVVNTSYIKRISENADR